MDNNGRNVAMAEKFYIGGNGKKGSEGTEKEENRI